MTERIVRKVEATRQMHTMAPLRALTRRKAACYLRISTRSDEQENSLENQRAHYEELFATSPDYEFAGCYPTPMRKARTWIILVSLNGFIVKMLLTIPPRLALASAFPWGKKL